MCKYGLDQMYLESKNTICNGTMCSHKHKPISIEDLSYWPMDVENQPEIILGNVNFIKQSSQYTLTESIVVFSIPTSMQHATFSFLRSACLQIRDVAFLPLPSD